MPVDESKLVDDKSYDLYFEVYEDCIGEDDDLVIRPAYKMLWQVDQIKTDGRSKTLGTGRTIALALQDALDKHAPVADRN